MWYLLGKNYIIQVWFILLVVSNKIFCQNWYVSYFSFSAITKRFILLYQVVLLFCLPLVLYVCLLLDFHHILSSCLDCPLVRHYIRSSSDSNFSLLCVCFVSALCLLCVWFVSALCLLCVCFVSALRLLCVCFVSVFYPQITYQWFS